MIDPTENHSWPPQDRLEEGETEQDKADREALQWSISDD